MTRRGAGDSECHLSPGSAALLPPGISARQEVWLVFVLSVNVPHPPPTHTHLVFRSVPRDGGRRGTWQSRAKLWPPWNLDDECVATDFNNKIKFVCLFSCEIKFPLTKLFPILILAS